MEAITLTHRQFEKLDSYPIQNGILNTESRFYLLPRKEKWNEKVYLLKYLYIQDQETMANKLFTVSMLGDKIEQLNIKELTIPKHLVVIDHKIVGFTVPKENGENLGLLLNDSTITNEEKIKYLYLVGNLIKRVQNNTKYIMPFHFGDLHAYNFLLERDKNLLHAVDLDSAYLDTGYPSPSYYLCRNRCLGNFPEKYHQNDSGIIVPDDNTDLFCYNMMLLETVARGKITTIGIEAYYDYLNYLKDLGFGKNLIHSFERLYWPTENINPCDYLDEIPVDKLGMAGLKVFTYKKQNRK